MVDTDRDLPRSGPRGSRRELRVGFLGRIHPKKRLELLIEAVTTLPPHVRLTIAGDGVDAARLRADATTLPPETQERIEWLGFVAPAERRRLFERLDLLAMPSAFESFGVAAAEAMMHGVPVLVSERTGIAELIERRGGGRIVPPHVPEIAAGIAALDADRDALAALGAEAKAAVSTELSLAEIGRALRDAYAHAASLQRRFGPGIPPSG